MVDQHKRAWFTGRKVTTSVALRPPWSGDEAQFLHDCTQCQQCVEHCPSQIIKVGKDGYPYIDFQFGECDFCQICAQQCQPNALSLSRSIAIQFEPEITQLCLAKKDIYCRSCAENCESQAIQFSYQQSAIAQPNINLTDCTHCGACVAPCPVDAIQFKPI